MSFPIRFLLSRPDACIPQFDLAYNVPDYSSSPSPICQVTFTPLTPNAPFSGAQGLPSSFYDTSRESLTAVLSPHSSHTDSTTTASDTSNPIRDFLGLRLTEPKRTKLVPFPQPASGSGRIVLQKCLGKGRTASVWQADIDDGDPTRRVMKMISIRHIASVVRESLFSEHVFPSSGLGQFVPKYYGTYAVCHGGWFAIMLEDVGKSVKNVDGYFQEDDELLAR